MSFDFLSKEASRERYGKRPLEKLPDDLLEACDRLRSQKREIDELRADLITTQTALVAARNEKFILGLKNGILMVIVGGLAAKGIEVAIVALFHAFRP